MTASARIRRTILVLFEAIAITAFLVMLGSSLVQIFCRYVLNAPLMWTEELARLMCVFTTYFGSVVVIVARDHIRVELIDAFLPPKGAAVVSVIGDLLIAWFLLSVAYGAYLMVGATWTTFTASMAWFRMAYVYVGVGIAVVAMTVVLALDINNEIQVLAGRKKDARA